MANTLDPMDLKQIITLHIDGLSNRKIGVLLGISRNTVNNYMQLFNAGDHTFEELLQMDNSKLNELFTSHTTINNNRYDELMSYFEKVNQARNHPGFTFQFHYVILLQKNPMEDKQRRRSREEMFPVVEAWQQSGLSKKSFCEEQGIIKSVFLYWVRKYRDEHEPDGFVPLTSGGALSLMQNYSIEIHYPNGVVLKLPANTPVSLVRHYVGQ
jgi:predicted transcriptional regulator